MGQRQAAFRPQGLRELPIVAFAVCTRQRPLFKSYCAWENTLTWRKRLGAVIALPHTAPLVSQWEFIGGGSADPSGSSCWQGPGESHPG